MKYLISENQYSLLLNVNLSEQSTKQPYGFNNSKGPSDYLGKGGEFERQQKGVYGDPSSMKLMIGKKQGTSLGDAMEEFRNSLFTPQGIAMSTFLNSFGWGAPVVVSAFGALLGWDIYKSMNGQTDWFNIVVDTISVVTSGALSGVFAPLMKIGRGALNSIEKVFEFLKSTSAWKNIKPYLKTIASGISKVGGLIGDGIKWLADNTGISFLLKVSGKIVSFFGGVAASILGIIGKGTQAVGKATTNIVSKVTGNPKVAQAAGQAVKTGVEAQGIQSGANKALGGPIKPVVVN